MYPWIVLLLFSENQDSLIHTENPANHGNKVDQNIPRP